MDDSNLFLKKIEERFDRFLSSNTIENYDFLSPEEQSKADRLMKSMRSQGAFLYGGYSEAERKIPVFIPEYFDVTDEEGAIGFFAQEPELCPLVILELEIPKHESFVPGHRDYLGALMGEGIKRQKIGDILIRPGGAQIVVLKELAEYLKSSLITVGRASVTARLLPIDKIDPGEVHLEKIRINVPSARLDNVVSAVFSLSRKSAQEAVARGLVFVDGIQLMKPDYQLKPAQKIVLRGKGKAIYLDTSGVSRKGKLYVEVMKYV